jgi:hypothetical protein
MKPLFTLAIVLTSFTLTAFADSSSNINNLTSVNRKAINSFQKSFHNAEVISWEVKGNLYKVTFNSNDKTMYAYYNAEGDQIAVSRNIHIDQLPLSLSMELKEKFNDSWLTDLFEVSANGETSYYATVANATTTTIYKTEGITGWTTFKKDRRK